MHSFCFYLDWSGWSPEVWAAWAQAILTVVAIYAASRLATRQERLAFRRKAEACVGLITYAEDTLASVEADPLSRTSLKSVATLAEQMQNISLDSVPDYRLIIAVNSVATSIAVLDGELTAWSKGHAAKEAFNVTAARRDVATAITRIQGAYEVVIPVANDLVRPTLKQRYRKRQLEEGKG